MDLKTESGSLETRRKILHQLLNMAEAMLAGGAEINRVEDTLERMGAAYGASRMNVFVITSSVVVTMLFPDGEEVTQTRRIQNPGGTDFGRLEALNDLSRRCCAAPVGAEELEAALEKLEAAPRDPGRLYAGSILAAGSFTVFFGGTLWDGLAAAAFAVMICFLQEKLMPVATNRMIFQLLASLLAGAGICMTARLVPFLHMDKIMIGDIMLLIPGIAMTNAIRDVLVGDTISGIMRLIESLLWAGSLACGFMVAIWLIGG